MKTVVMKKSCVCVCVCMCVCVCVCVCVCIGKGTLEGDTGRGIGICMYV